MCLRGRVWGPASPPPPQTRQTHTRMTPKKKGAAAAARSVAARAPAPRPFPRTHASGRRRWPGRLGPARDGQRPAGRRPLRGPLFLPACADPPVCLPAASCQLACAARRLACLMPVCPSAGLRPPSPPPPRRRCLRAIPAGPGPARSGPEPARTGPPVSLQSACRCCLWTGPSGPPDGPPSLRAGLDGESASASRPGLKQSATRKGAEKQTSRPAPSLPRVGALPGGGGGGGGQRSVRRAKGGGRGGVGARRRLPTRI